MRLLNGPAITQAYLRFLRSFLALLLSLVLLVLCFFQAMRSQTWDLETKQKQLDVIFSNQRALNQTIDNLYTSLDLLNTESLSNEAKTNRISTAKRRIDELLKRMSNQNGSAAYAVHYKLMGQVREAIGLKDSIYKANERGEYIKQRMRFIRK
jgi:hypothetical protein